MNDLASDLQKAAARHATDRRRFLRSVAGLGAAGTAFGLAPFRALAQPSRTPKVVVVTFGGGARDAETFAPEGHANIPHMLHELIPQGTFYAQVINHGILGHYVATASLATGAYETLNNFAAVPPANPTVFEYFRRDLRRPATDAWVVAPSNGFNRIGSSDHRGFGPDLGAEVILPKRLLAAAASGHTTGDLQHLLRDNYETPLFAPPVAPVRAAATPGAVPTQEPVALQRTADLLKLSLADFSAHARSLESPDELSVFIARRLMAEQSPSLLWLTLHDIDIAHSGAFSLYLEGIRRSDRLCAEVWHAIQTDPEYKDRTTLFILPDFGRDSDFSPSGNGFQHHRTGDVLSRTTWMLVLGPGIRQNVIHERPVDSLDLVPTLGKLLGFTPSLAQGRPLVEVL